ncbi:LysR substrate-binding domain-containing protein [Kribbella sp.]|uniref:LysR substrate-binding domain-containing protein n=1 Tax=Kribbella sp. TaxID=1871183 RepID=UPI002D2A1C9E|nr:LysR substrate-binding domain-containing protein [Kribbella sp.]HZX03245.1 LysR substrate-binding domain-containing protein [Kribbella sp.]
MYNVNRLRMLREVRVRGTLAAAAEALGLNPSSVSHQLSLLEREVGVPLLEPVGRKVRLTAEALILVEHTEHILRHLEEAEAEIAAAHDAVRGRVRIATFQTAAHTVIPEAVRALAAAHPALDVQVSHIPVQDALPALIARDFDVVLQEEFPGQPQVQPAGVETAAVARDPLWLLVPAASPGSLAEVAARPWVMEPVGTPARRWAESTCRRAGFEPAVAFESTDVLLHVRLVAAGAAVALVPGLVLRACDTTAVQTRALEGDPARTISIAVRRGSANAPAIAAVRDALTSLLDRSTPGG